MESIETLAVSRAISEKADRAARAKIQPGVHPIDFTVRIRGAMNVSPDQEKKVAASVPWQKWCAMLLSRLAPQCQRKAYEDLEAIMSGYEVDSTPVKSEAVAIVEKVLNGKTKTVRGPVSAALEVTIASDLCPCGEPAQEGIQFCEACAVGTHSGYIRGVCDNKMSVAD